MIRESKDRAAPLILDTENLFRGFGYLTVEERALRAGQPSQNVPAGEISKWEGWQKDDADALQKVVVGTEPGTARTKAAGVLKSLCDWAERKSGRGLSPRLSYGKDTDPAVERLLRNGFKQLGFVHHNVPPGRDEADDEVIERINYYRDVTGRGENLPSSTVIQDRELDKRDVLVVGSEDEKIWLALIEHVDQCDDEESLRFIIAIPPLHKGVHHKLYKSAFWKDLSSPGDRVWVEVSKSTSARRRERISHGYLHAIHHEESSLAKRAGRLNRATTPPAQVVVAPRPVDWVAVISLVERLRMPRPLVGEIKSGMWAAALSTALSDHLSADVIESVLARIESAFARVQLDEVKILGMPPASVGRAGDADEARWQGVWSKTSDAPPAGWPDILFFALYVPSRVPNWPYPEMPTGRQIRKLRWLFREELTRGDAPEPEA